MNDAWAPVAGLFVMFVVFPASWVLLWAFVRWVKHKIPYDQ